MSYEHEWERAALIAACSEPILASDELKLFDWHVRETEAIINQMEAEEKKVIRNQLEGGDDCAGSSWIAVEYFIKRIRYGQVIYLVSLVETFLTNACERLRIAVGKQNIPFGLNELSGEKLQKRRKFLERYGRISVSDELWTPIEAMVSIRNICVHENGCAKANEKRASALPSGVKVDQGELVLDASYIRVCLSAVGILAENVESELRQVVDRCLQGPDGAGGKVDLTRRGT